MGRIPRRVESGTSGIPFDHAECPNAFGPEFSGCYSSDGRERNHRNRGRTYGFTPRQFLACSSDCRPRPRLCLHDCAGAHDGGVCGSLVGYRKSILHVANRLVQIA